MKRLLQVVGNFTNAGFTKDDPLSSDGVEWLDVYVVGAEITSHVSVSLADDMYQFFNNDPCAGQTIHPFAVFHGEAGAMLFMTALVPFLTNARVADQFR